MPRAQATKEAFERLWGTQGSEDSLFWGTFSRKFGDMKLPSNKCQALKSLERSVL